MILVPCVKFINKDGNCHENRCSDFSSATICLARVLTSSSVAVPNNEQEISPINGNKDRLDFDCDDGRRFLEMSDMISSRRELRECAVRMRIA